MADREESSGSETPLAKLAPVTSDAAPTPEAEAASGAGTDLPAAADDSEPADDVADAHARTAAALGEMDETELKHTALLQPKILYQDYYCATEKRLESRKVDPEKPEHLQSLQRAFFQTARIAVQKNPSLTGTKAILKALDGIHDAVSKKILDFDAAKRVMRAVCEATYPLYERILQSSDVVWKALDDAPFLRDLEPRLSDYFMELPLRNQQQMFVHLHTVACLARRHEQKPQVELDHTYFKIFDMLHSGVDPESEDFMETLMGLLDQKGGAMSKLMK